MKISFRSSFVCFSNSKVILVAVLDLEFFEFALYSSTPFFMFVFCLHRNIYFNRIVEV